MVLNGPSDVMTALYFNMAAGAPYNDPKFRGALAYAINRQDLVSRVLQGTGDVGNPGWLAPSSPWYNPNVPKYSFNLSTARSMLDSAGYTLPSGATVRQSPGGGQLILPLVFDSSNPAPAQVLQSQLQQVGIQLDLHGLDFASLRSTATQGKYSLALLTLGGLGGDPDFIFQSFNPQAPAGVQNFTYAHGYANTQMSTLESQQRATLNQAQRKAIVDQMEQIVATDLPSLSLYYQPNIWIFNKQVFNAWYFTPGGVGGGNPSATNKSVLVTGSR
jgi:peptide/nickel transport system substrate-binding protein